MWLSIVMLKKWIYESPDGGKTVYRRQFGSQSAQRELVSRQPGPHIVSLHINDIITASITDAALKDMLDQLMMYWTLKHANN